MPTEPKTREEAIDMWYDATYSRCCSCHINPPCSFCVTGYGLPLDEYLDQFAFKISIDEALREEIT